jgi:phosphohistidine phosphatase
MTTRTLTLIRHAKSSWDDPSFSDFKRPLNKRGKADAPKVGAALKQAGLCFDQILCSDAKRAKQTLSLLRQGIEVDEKVIEYRHDLYGASADELLSCISSQPPAIRHLALIGHNPGMEDLANSLLTQAIGPMPTCCVVHIKFDCEDWLELPVSEGNIGLMIRPRDL